MQVLKFSILFLFFLIAGYIESSAQQRPNILWIVSEDNSASYMKQYGNSLADTPNLDRLSQRKGTVIYDNAFATTPVCAPSRFTLITGTYANSMGTENMRSTYAIPDFIKFFPKYLKKAGYYTTNNAKKDYNTVDQPSAWDESSHKATYKNRPPGQPFFHVKNLGETHESRIHSSPYDTLIHDPGQVPVPPYLPSTRPVRRDLAHYYDQVKKMDAHVGKILKKLKESGQADNTIVFYYSDHGGVLPRSKRFMFESGLHIPLMVYFPPKYAYLKPKVKRTDRLVTFVDFAPTVLSLAGIKPPDYMQGKAFLGKYAAPPRDDVHMYRARMDERYDLIRTVRNKKYLYVHNYMPQRIYGQHVVYLWKAASMRSWQKQYEEGNLNPTQRKFFQPKPNEELYDVAKDPHNIHNLAKDYAYKDTLRKMRQENLAWMKKLPDLGFIPESMIEDISQGKSLYRAVREKNIPMDKVIETAEKASMARKESLDMLAMRLNDANAIVRYWAAMGLAIAGKRAEAYEQQLLNTIGDSSPEVRLEVAEALYNIGLEDKAMNIIQSILGQPGLFLNIEALNVLESLHPHTLAPQLLQKVRKLNKKYDVDSEPKKYIYRATESLLSKLNEN